MSSAPAESIVVVPFGDGAVRVELPPSLRGQRRLVLDRLRALPGVRDVVVAEQHAAVVFEAEGPIPDVAAALVAVEHGGGVAAAGELVVVHVRYDGPDLPAVAAWAGRGTEEVIALHLAPTYVVETIGFQPGFAYLGSVDPRIARPRLPSPRQRVPAGSVGIAGARTGVYPFASPGGWNLIGTVVGFAPFDTERGAALQLGDRVRFERV
ncbi:5-oxoprolinase subunit B family protein [Vulgatibacter sp.]|uniref:5-oxoprolinase subunit B family protein n=1 Tax=Vulgatibacter sp. TaxID=1971226 RepID=UPI003562ACDD